MTKPPAPIVRPWSIECWQKGKLHARHRCSGELINREILERFGLKDRNWTVVIHEEHRPDLAHTIQFEGK